MTSCAGSEGTSRRSERAGEGVAEGREFRWSWGCVAVEEGVCLRGRWLHCDSPCCHQTDGDPWVALSIPTWEACKWRGCAVIIYSPQLLTLDSELITEEGKSDRTWRVPEPVTLISVRCLQQGVREEELASVSLHCGSAHALARLCFPARWGDMRVHVWVSEPWLKMTRGRLSHGPKYTMLLLFILLARAVKNLLNHEKLVRWSNRQLTL